MHICVILLFYNVTADKRTATKRKRVRIHSETMVVTATLCCSYWTVRIQSRIKLKQGELLFTNRK